MAQVTAAAASMKRDVAPDTPVGCGGGDHSSDDDGSSTMDVKPPIGNHGGSVQGERGRGKGPQGGGGAASSDAGSKKTKGRVKIKMEFIDNKLRRYTTFSKRKTGIMKKVSGREGGELFPEGRERNVSRLPGHGTATSSSSVHFHNFPINIDIGCFFIGEMRGTEKWIPVF